MTNPDIDYRDIDYPDIDYPDMSTVASAMETTGMFPTPPLTEEEYESRQEQSGMEIPRIDRLIRK